jgi:ArsR family transcriptional regulator
MMKVSLDKIVEELRAAGEITRRRVLALLKSGELSVGELTQILGQSQPRLSRHMKFLTSARLVERLPEGAWVFYRLTERQPQRAFLEAILAQIDPEDDIIRSDFERLKEIRETRQTEAASYFEQAAKDWDRLRSLHYPEKDIEAAILRIVGERSFASVIDLGTGTGRMLKILGPLTKEAEGLDLSHQMLTIARANLADPELEHVSVCHGDATRTPYAAASADLVIIHQVLHILDEPQKAIQEAARLLKPGGNLLVVDFAPHNLEYLRKEQSHRHLGFNPQVIEEWCGHYHLKTLHVETFDPPSDISEGLAVNIFCAERTAE